MTLVTIYWILFLVGLGFALISVIFAGFAEAMGGHDVDFSADHDMDLGGADTSDFGGADISHDFDVSSGDFYHGHGEVALSPVSPITIAAFVGGFGGGGLIGFFLHMPTWGTILVGLAVGFAIAFGIYYLMYVINKSNVSSEARVSDAVGITAEIITPIIEDATGEIAYILRGSRYNGAARSLDGKSIGRGRAVKIWRIVGSTCYVKEILPEEADSPGADPIDDPEKRVKEQ